MGVHALLSASSSSRWIHCPPSARLCEGCEDKGSGYALQGTDAHSLCQYKLEKALGRDAEDPTENLTFFDAEMEACAENYAVYVMEQLAKIRKICTDPVVLVEQRLDFSRYVPDGFGTGDCVIVADGTLFVIDYKYGKGILVEAEKNPQMMCYALGALELFDGIYDVETVDMTIFQPRREHISTYTVSKAELLQWAAEVLTPAARLAYAGEGEYKAGGHCRFCKAKAACRKRAEYNLELARYDFAMPPVLENEEISAILPRIDALVSWAGDIKKYALSQALNGASYPGFKVVEGRSNRRYTDESAAAAAVLAAGFDPYEQKLLGITAMTAALGKQKFEEILGGLTYKPQGRPALVPESDKRPAMHTAGQDFSDM